MAFHIDKCETDEQWYRFSEFFIKHYKKMNPALDPESALVEIMMYKEHGGVYYGESRGEIAGFIAYSVGTPDMNFEDSSTVFIGTVIILEQFRFSKLLYLGWRAFIDGMMGAEIPVTDVYFLAVKENEYLNAMYSKMARKTGEFQSNYGVHCTYSTQFHEFIRRYGKMSARNKSLSRDGH